MKIGKKIKSKAEADKFLWVWFSHQQERIKKVNRLNHRCGRYSNFQPSPHTNYCGNKNRKCLRYPVVIIFHICNTLMYPHAYICVFKMEVNKEFDCNTHTSTHTHTPNQTCAGAHG